jgi:Holliday junction resolvasome RuvABC endonuclease subunit
MPGKVILTLDIATVTGWAVSQPGRNGPLYGSHRMVSGTIGDDLGRALAAFRDWLTDMLAIHNPDEIWFEAPVPTTNRSIATMRLLMAYPAFAEELAYRRNTPIFEAHSGTIRKAVLGSGRAQKPDVLRWAALRGHSPHDDNAADALLLLAYADGGAV